MMLGHKYEIEDVILAELRQMPGFISKDDTDIVRVKFEGTIDVGQLGRALLQHIYKSEV